MKMIILIVGLVLGFGIGVYWGHHNQEAAGNLAAKEEEWVLKGKMEATQAIKEKLDRVLAKESSPPAPGAGFVGGSAVGGSGSGSTQADALKQLRDEQDQQLKSIQGRLATMPK